MPEGGEAQKDQEKAIGTTRVRFVGKDATQQDHPIVDDLEGPWQLSH